jgi:hypothetical protein
MSFSELKLGKLTLSKKSVIVSHTPSSGTFRFNVHTMLNENPSLDPYVTRKDKNISMTLTILYIFS